jgi:lysophospholipase L1-like esterase
LIKLTLLWTCCLFLFPLLILQGLWARHRIEKLPDGLPPHEGTVGTVERELRIIGVGDSVVAGVGVEHLSQSLTAKVAEALSAQFGYKVSWSAYGANGDQARDLIRKIEALPSEKVDAVIVSIGVNDVSGLTPITRWQFEITTMIAMLKDHFQAPIVFMGLPPMGRFPGLPQPLRFALGTRAAMLDLMLKNAARVVPGVHWSDSNLELAPVASDGYHPNEVACEMVAREIVANCLRKELT